MLGNWTKFDGQTNCICLVVCQIKLCEIHNYNTYLPLVFVINPLTYGFCASTVNNGGHVGTVKYAVLCKPPGDSLPVVSAHSFDSNWTLALLESAEKENFTKNIAGRGRRYETDTLSTELPRPVKYCDIFSTYTCIHVCLYNFIRIAS